MNSSTTSSRDLLEEASDPATDTERLRELAEHEDEDVWLAAIQNPGVPEDVWREQLLYGIPEAWSNPMAAIYLLVWSPKPNDPYPLEIAIRRATQALWKNPERCSPDGKVLLNVQLMNWWASTNSTQHMMDFLLVLASAKGNGSDEHREVVRLLILCVRTVPSLTTRDLQALELLDAWCAGGKDLRREARSLAALIIVRDTANFAIDPLNPYNAWSVISELLNEVAIGEEEPKRRVAKAKRDRHLADLIRRAMPLPPQVK